MKLPIRTAFLAAFVVVGAQAATSELPRLENTAKRVTIIRDDWGIAHVYGKTDADVVFGAMYAQAEDDFNRVETNYLNAMGRLAETEGAGKVIQDLRMKLFIDPVELKQRYATCPVWLRKLMDSYAEGLNYYLVKHPDVKPRVIKHFEPWMALSFTEGSIGGDIERVNVGQLQAFYEKRRAAVVPEEDESKPKEPTGSNGIAIAPGNTTGKHALLLINPHTSFYFRSELQMVSEEGLNAYGASTWGQFFIYQGFNDKAGWMHTSSGVDVIDEYLETVEDRGGKYFYKYGNAWRPMMSSEIVVPYKSAGAMTTRKFTVYRTHHGPVVREVDGKWVSVKLMQEPVKALTQSYMRTKARNYKAYRQTMELKANSSNNTIFADADGVIAYFHGNFIPRRDTSFDWKKPVDGSNPETEWKGLLNIDETPNLLNPASGWLYNSNNWPWTAAGASSPKRADYPAYVENGTESARGRHAVRVLEGKKDFTIKSLLEAAYDSYLPWFEKPVPALVKAWDGLPAATELKQKLAPQIALLRAWDFRWGAGSVETSLAVYWAEEARRRSLAAATDAGLTPEEYIGTKAAPEVLVQALATASEKLMSDFGTWKTAWGEINRFQRLNDDIQHSFDDAASSIPVGFTSAEWGSLASFGFSQYPATKKRYGISGNSFVAAVEFGDKVRAVAVSAGGASGDPKSKHFNDQALRYSKGELRDVYFYKADLRGHTEREYHPGQ
ncbi:MAG: peptidase penicillin amidase [Bryobacterales bacterium]|nr:peptidase penicillin amidase [Bryobacterales bacterium]